MWNATDFGTFTWRAKMTKWYKPKLGEPGILPVLQFLGIRRDREGSPISTMFDKIKPLDNGQWRLQICSGDYFPPAM